MRQRDSSSLTFGHVILHRGILCLSASIAPQLSNSPNIEIEGLLR